MSLEQALAANTAAIQLQTAAIQALSDAWNALREQASQLKAAGVTQVASAGVPQADVPEVATQRARGKPAPKLADTPAAPTEAVSASPSEPAADEVTDVDIKALSAAVTAAATRNREGLVAVLASYNGAKRATEVPPEQWGALLADLEAL